MNKIFNLKFYNRFILFLSLIAIILIYESCTGSNTSQKTGLFISDVSSDSINLKKAQIDTRYKELEEYLQKYGSSPWRKVSVFNENYKWGLKNDREEIVVEGIYDDVKIIDLSSSYTAFIILKKDNKWGVIELLKSEGDYYGAIGNRIAVPFEYDDIKFNHMNYSLSTFFIKNNGKWGAVDNNGEIILLPKYDSIEPFQIFEDFNFNYTIVYLDGKCGYISTETDSVIIPFIYDEISDKYKAEYLKVKLKGKAGLINKENKIIIPIEYDDLDPKANFMLLKAKLNGKWGIIDSIENIMFPIKYDSIDFPPYRYEYDHVDKIYGIEYTRQDSYYKITKAKLNNKWGLIDSHGKEIIPIIYDSINFSYPSNYYRVFNNGKTGLIDKNNNIILAIKYDDFAFLNYETDRYPEYNIIENWGSYIVSVKIGGKWGFVDRNGKITPTLKYERSK